jgi:nucleotide-binding universal stress UspA family protein
MALYRHILVPTDGSALSRKAVKAAVQLAKTLGARVTGAYVIPPFVPPMYAEGMVYAAVSPQRQRDAAKRAGTQALKEVVATARKAGLQAGAALLAADYPWEGILKAAKARRCDLIVMASHGRRGLAGLLLGSETTKVLTRSKIPVLVCR